MKIGIALPVVCFCAFVGGLLGSWLFSPKAELNPTFETVTVTGDLVVTDDEEQGAGCRLRADGTVTASQGVLANQVRAKVIAAQSILASTNPTTASFDHQQIMVQMTADPQSGGKVVAVNREATLIPSADAAQQGSAACIRFHPDNGRPEIFTHDLARGEVGKSYMVAYGRAAIDNEPASASNASEKTAIQR